RSGETEDVFPYYRPGARWTALSRVRIPLAVIIGSRDEYLDRKPQELIDAFREHAVRARSFAGIIVAGARHGFQDHEGALADTIVHWMRRRASGRLRKTRSRAVWRRDLCRSSAVPISDVMAPQTPAVSPSANDDERRLIEAAKIDPLRFADLYERHFDRVYAF